MIKLFFLLLFLPFIGQAHPGIGIVKDSKGNIYYTDLHHVWKIANGTRTLSVPNVHTHELYIDSNDNLYGEGGEYDEKANKFYHYLWVYHPNGKVDTVIGMKQAYIQQDFSLSRDIQGNEYYIKQFLTRPDTSHIYKNSPDGRESIFASGKFRAVKWLHPQDNGSLLYVSNNAIYRVDARGNIELVKDSIGNTSPSFKFSGNNITIWGVWEDKAQNIYVAVFSDQTVKKIDKNGILSNYYKSKGNWAPLHGVFDNDNRLWILEGSDKNEVRVMLAGANHNTIIDRQNSNSRTYLIAGMLVIGVLILYLTFRNSNSRITRTLLR